MKLRPDAARQAERSLSLASMALSRTAGGAQEMAPFLGRHGIRRMTPVFPGLLREKKLRGLSFRALLEQSRRRRTRPSAPPSPPSADRLDLTGTYALELADGASEADVERTLASLQRDASVEYAHRERVYRAQYTPNDPYFASGALYAPRLISCPTAWDTTLGQGVVVAVVDTGLDRFHPDIDANIWSNPAEIPGNGRDDDGNGLVDDTWGWDFVADDADPADENGHGTHVSGTIAAEANNRTGIVGVAPLARVMTVRVLDADGSGTTRQIADGIRYAADEGADVINLSLGGPGPDPTLAAAIAYAHALNVVVVAAAGNSGADADQFSPANSTDVITVAASDRSDRRASFSNFGDKIDVAAPGVQILSLQARGTYVSFSGTSMAAPQVSGAAALILAAFPDYTNERVREVLRLSAEDLGAAGRDAAFGFGRIDVARALGEFPAVRVQFQKNGKNVAPGYRADAGDPFGDRGNGYAYGWNTRNKHGVDRNSKRSPDPRYDTFNVLQSGKKAFRWEIALPPGVYSVHVVAGDASKVNSVYRIDVEGTPVVDGTPDRDHRWIEGTQNIALDDGLLTVTSGAGAVRDKIAFIDIVLLEPAGE